MSAASSRLSPLQRELLDRFFAEPTEFFLTGGAALAGFHLGHRSTDDLDLFAPPSQDMEAGVRALRRAAASLGAVLEALQDSPEFRRLAVRREGEVTIVDLAIDRAPQLEPTKTTIGQVRIDSAREIAANKVCAIIGRTAPRDLVDLEALLARGARLEDVLSDARVKDAAADPATLAWVLSRYRIAPTAPLPAGVSRESIDAFRAALIERLVPLAAPRE